MRAADIAHVRTLMARGLDDREIAEVLAQNEAAAAEEEALYGAADDRYAPGRMPRECDEFYARNDAGEWLAHM